MVSLSALRPPASCSAAHTSSWPPHGSPSHGCLSGCVRVLSLPHPYPCPIPNLSSSCSHPFPVHITIPAQFPSFSLPVHPMPFPVPVWIPILSPSPSLSFAIPSHSLSGLCPHLYPILIPTLSPPCHVLSHSLPIPFPVPILNPALFPSVSHPDPHLCCCLFPSPSPSPSQYHPHPILFHPVPRPFHPIPIPVSVGTLFSPRPMPIPSIPVPSCPLQSRPRISRPPRRGARGFAALQRGKRKPEGSAQPPGEAALRRWVRGLRRPGTGSVAGHPRTAPGAPSPRVLPDPGSAPNKAAALPLPLVPPLRGLGLGAPLGGWGWGLCAHQDVRSGEGARGAPARGLSA